MRIARTILIKSIVKPYFRQNAGLIGFLYFMMIFAAGRVDNAGPLEYHYELIRGMLINPSMFMWVFGGWLLYARRCDRFVVQTMRRPGFGFLNMLAQMKTRRVFGLLLGVQCLLFLPVTLYVLIIVGVGFYNHWYGSTWLVIGGVLGICGVGAARYVYLLRHPGKSSYFLAPRTTSAIAGWFYGGFFIKYVMQRRKILLLAIKIFSCGMLYMMVVHQVPVEYDLRMIFLFYTFGLLGHGVLIHDFREMEEARMGFYRGLPVSLLKRFSQYAYLYLLLFVPEMITIGLLTPGYLHYTDAILFVLFGYSVLLLLNSILFIRSFKMVSYLKIIFCLFFLLYMGVVAGGVLWITLAFLVLSVSLFFLRYYRYERGASGVAV